ncbi:MAG: TIGR03067 domain-containing protein [Gemmatimonadetes bacterium]|nr:TIGR03067 domain-containing protein [Gemmatimonadota bacterium]
MLARLRQGDREAAAEFQEHLPEARQLSTQGVLEAGYRLADAQSVVARRSGFSGWPALARHVHVLRSLEGEWAFTSLEVNGETVPSSLHGTSRILIDGDRFRTESPEANYDGEFLIDVEAEPHTIDIAFVEGPEAGQSSLGVFTLDGDTLTICLGLVGATRPSGFRTTQGSGHALETLRRASAARPVGVTGGHTAAGKAQNSPARQSDVARTDDSFVVTPSALDAPLQGGWQCLELVRDGGPLPDQWLPAGQRVATGDEVQVIFGGQVMAHARVRYDASVAPAHLDYLYLAGPTMGRIAHGIVAFDGTELRVNMAPPGAPRPEDWTSPKGSGRTFSRWVKRE